MNVLLVRPRWNVRWMITPITGLGYIAAAAQQAGHSVAIHDAWLHDQTPAQAANVHGMYDLIGVQVFLDSLPWVKEYIRLVRKLRPFARIIVGGPYVTAMGDEARKETGADIGVMKEFDHDLDYWLPFIMNAEPGQTFDCGWSDVNKLPIPDWELLDLPQYWPYMYNVSVPTKGKRIGIVQTTRGCASRCSFCSSGATMGHIPRLRHVENVIAEVVYLKFFHDINELWIQDDNATVNYKRALRLFAELEPLKLHIRLPTGVRWEHIDNTMVAAMKQAGVYFTGMGIESGNPRVLKRIRKNFNQKQGKEAIARLANANIQTIGFFIFGLATETREEMQDTLNYAMSTKLHHAQFGQFIPYPGAEDWNERSLLSAAELTKIQRNATLKFYCRPRIIWNFLKNFQWSQLKALWLHPWIKRWTWRG